MGQRRQKRTAHFYLVSGVGGSFDKAELTLQINVALLPTFSFCPQHSCQSDGNSIYFHGTEGSESNFATTRDVDLSTEDAQEQWAEEFESQPKG